MRFVQQQEMAQSVRFDGGVGSALSTDCRLFDEMYVKVNELYGMTECSAVQTISLGNVRCPLSAARLLYTARHCLPACLPLPSLTYVV